MKFSKIFNEYSKNNYNTYFHDMYGYNKSAEKEEKLKKEESILDSAIEEYLDAIDNIKTSRVISKYKEALNKNPRDDAKIEALEKDIEHMLTTPRLKLQKNRRAYKKANDNNIIYSFDKFKNEFILNECILNVDEKDLIFGSLMESILDTIELDEAQKVSQGNVNQAIKNAQRKTGDVSLDNMSKMAARNAVTDKIQDDIEERKQDPVSGESLKEADENPVIATLEKQQVNIDKKIENLQDQKSKIQERKEKAKQYADMKDKVEEAKSINENNEEIVSTSKNIKDVLEKEDIDSLDESFVRISPDLRKEKTASKDIRSEKKVSKDLRDEKTINKRPVSQYDTMLYNGASGEVLKYMINGEINNNNIDVLEISKLVEKDGEAQIVLKKIKALLNKASKKELSYEEYTQLKVLKSQFKSIFTKFKNQYNNRYKN